MQLRLGGRTHTATLTTACLAHGQFVQRLLALDSGEMFGPGDLTLMGVRLVDATPTERAALKQAGYHVAEVGP